MTDLQMAETSYCGKGPWLKLGQDFGSASWLMAFIARRISPLDMPAFRMVHAIENKWTLRPVTCLWVCGPHIG